MHTTEEIGQVAYAVDALHTQDLLFASDEARLCLLVNDMFGNHATVQAVHWSTSSGRLLINLECNEYTAGQLNSLFQLDCLAARLCRDSTNLLVLAGA
ncbi:hypothetical protein [Mycobacterium uberis]|uniref:hypothetical protein n=1 Tax=Mycobacterium uberis TaxID=2162698 RepID=UPI000E2FFEAB|nr:hypothetical protein [Mycobacterium uberis]